MMQDFCISWHAPILSELRVRERGAPRIQETKKIFGTVRLIKQVLLWLCKEELTLFGVYQLRPPQKDFLLDFCDSHRKLFYIAVMIFKHVLCSDVNLHDLLGSSCLMSSGVIECIK
jgi:hypothetical protein